MSWSLAEQATRRRRSQPPSSTPTSTQSIARLAHHYDGLLISLAADLDASLFVAEVLSRADVGGVPRRRPGQGLMRLDTRDHHRGTVRGARLR